MADGTPATKVSKRGKRAAPKPARAPKKSTRAARRLPILAAPEPERGQVPCLSCGLCCTYVAVDIDEPTCMTDAAQILWYLYHQQVSVYFDGEEGWTLQFDSRCNHLQADNKCAIYDKRPPICRTYSEESCEVNADDEGLTFTTAEEFLAWLEPKHPRIHKKLAERFLPGPEHLRGVPQNPRPLPAFVPAFKKLRAKGLRLGA
jgi:Fe-S-cluster containining protein